MFRFILIFCVNSDDNLKMRPFNGTSRCIQIGGISSDGGNKIVRFMNFVLSRAKRERKRPIQARGDRPMAFNGALKLADRLQLR